MSVATNYVLQIVCYKLCNHRKLCDKLLLINVAESILVISVF